MRRRCGRPSRPSARVNLGVASAGVGGGIGATIGLDLSDPNDDGKIRASEFAAHAGDEPAVPVQRGRQAHRGTERVRQDRLRVLLSHQALQYRRGHAARFHLRLRPRRAAAAGAGQPERRRADPEHGTARGRPAVGEHQGRGRELQGHPCRGRGRERDDQQSRRSAPSRPSPAWATSWPRAALGNDTITLEEGVLATAELWGDFKDPARAGDFGDDTAVRRRGRGDSARRRRAPTSLSAAPAPTSSSAKTVTTGSRARVATTRSTAASGPTCSRAATATTPCCGGDDDDDLSGGAGNDRLEGGLGIDQLTGDAGRDIADRRPRGRCADRQREMTTS